MSPVLGAGTEALPLPEVLWGSCDGMMVIDDDRRILAMNPAMEALTGYSAEGAVGRMGCAALFSCRDFHGCRLADHPKECPGLKAIQRFQPVRHAEYVIQTAEGKQRVVQSSYTPIQLSGRPVWGLVVMRDATAQKRRERRLAHRAMTDPLTGLPNREVLLRAFSRELNRSTRTLRPLSLGLVDLDGFKVYNDRYGHPAGDEILKSVARRLHAGRRAPDLIARYGGDEFGLLLPETDTAGAMVVAERLCHAVRVCPAAVTISVGISVFPEDGRTLEALLGKADQRLYEAKRFGSNQVVGPQVPTL